MAKDTVVKVLRCVPSKRVSLALACATCSHHKVVMIDIDKGKDICDVHEASVDIPEPSKWLCDKWDLSEETQSQLLNN